QKKYRQVFITSREDWRAYRETKDAKLLCAFDQFIHEKNKFEENFYKAIKADIEKALKNESDELKVNELNEVINRLARSQFLLKQKTYFNASIPHQNNVYEAEIILKNQQRSEERRVGKERKNEC